MTKSKGLYAPKGAGMVWIRHLLEETERTGCRDWPYGRSGEYPYCSEGLVTHVVLELSGALRPAPPNHHALHSCDRPICVAPWHLRWGSNHENIADTVTRGRRPRSRLDEAAFEDIASRYIHGRHQHARGNARELAAEYGVSVGTIRLIAKGRLTRPKPMPQKDH